MRILRANPIRDLRLYGGVIAGRSLIGPGIAKQFIGGRGQIGHDCYDGVFLERGVDPVLTLPTTSFLIHGVLRTPKSWSEYQDFVQAHGEWPYNEGYLIQSYLGYQGNIQIQLMSNTNGSPNTIVGYGTAVEANKLVWVGVTYTRISASSTDYKWWLAAEGRLPLSGSGNLASGIHVAVAQPLYWGGTFTGGGSAVNGFTITHGYCLKGGLTDGDFYEFRRSPLFLFEQSQNSLLVHPTPSPPALPPSGRAPDFFLTF